MTTQNSKIKISDYNDFYTPLYTTLGPGSGTTGYGQTLSMSPTSVTTSTKISAGAWALIENDVKRLATHQGTLGSITLPDITTQIALGKKISATDITNLQDALTTVTSVSNIYSIDPGQRSDELLVSSSRSTQWKVEIDHFWTVDFGSVENARYFFNAGGTINIIPNFTKNATTLINNDWQAVINVGTFSFGYTNLTLNGSQVSSIGFYDLTSTEQQLYTRSGNKVTGASMYSSNDMKITARCDISNNSSGGARYIYFKLYLQDLKTTSDVTWGTDEYVTGTVTNTVRMYRPTESVAGQGVVVTAPTASTTTALTVGS